MSNTTKEQLAEMLNGREIGREITKEEEQVAAASGLVIVFGYSDDGCEFRGAIHDEVGAYDYTEIRFTKDGKFYPSDMEEHAEFMEQHGMLDAFNNKFCNMIAASYSPWKYETDIPHAAFDVMEDGEVFCRGIVFHMDDLK